MVGSNSDSGEHLAAGDPGPAGDGSARANLRRLAWLRLAAIVVLLAAARAVLGVEGDSQAFARIGLVAAGSGALSLFTLWRFRRARPVHELELCGQLALDLIALTLVFQASSGAANPFVSLYLVPLVVAAATLPRLQVWLLSLLACGAYTWLMLEYAPLMTHHHPGATGQFDLHVLGMWGNFLLSAAIIGIAVVNMGAALRERDARLARAREDLLRNEQILGLATLAAGAAHELGTPLTTIAVLSQELEFECAERSDLQADLRMLRTQVALCKDIIQRMLSRNAIDGSEAAPPVEAGEFVAQVAETWRLMRPATPLSYRSSLPAAGLLMREDATLAQALISVLNNAADASPDGITLHATGEAGRIVLRVLDQGAGIDARAASELGRAWFSTKGEGRGLGLFLSNATLERLGGSVRLENRPEGGACTTVEWPLALTAEAGP